MALYLLLIIIIYSTAPHCGALLFIIASTRAAVIVIGNGSKITATLPCEKEKGDCGAGGAYLYSTLSRQGPLTTSI